MPECWCRTVLVFRAEMFGAPGAWVSYLRECQCGGEVELNSHINAGCILPVLQPINT